MLFYHRSYLMAILLVVLLASCTPPKEVFNYIERSLGNDPPVTDTSAKVGDFVDVAIKAKALYPQGGTFPEKTSKVMVGAVFQLDEKLSCPSSPQTSLPAGVVLESGSSLTKQVDLVVKRGQLVDFGHTLRFTSTSPQKIAVLVVIWGKPSDVFSTGDQEDAPLGVLSCKPLDLISGNGGSKAHVVTFQ